ncbi:RNA methyltransferase [Candidatus Kinetoplastidibacterium crithidiae]|uniref:tRNA (cytidine/uridine-2'-O-)-methyltransferase TrmJ n=1 Tax=Candidatus Kinetoplastidibacterium crithidiae TCC036E TaxID=1208918 RepID=M1LP43_9PROT|nr:TrmJ/YjtD family RNA methyltransferase [Candidatus Kinetoplastibacterium crithidii]AFZ83176.1 tRNA/rRNA methyltransferase [Candidatus Kinetoplastibacterium crithidii (ex Angomonas deanei ATCC 30255)]AGF47452.1 tRNA/rRNA methyltransferase [Candidatus Kinetoplastibacterium crithidii TCC036E]
MFSKINFILVNPSHPGNIGSSARALKNMNFQKLIIVNHNNYEITENNEAIKFASNAQDVLKNITICKNLKEALSNTSFSVALTARSNRKIDLCSYQIRDAIKVAISHMINSNKEISFVFGSENHGLTNQQISLCNCIANIPSNPEYQSLNISHALQIVAWELYYAIMEQNINITKQNSHKKNKNNDMASISEIITLLEKLEKILIKINFLNPLKPKHLMLKLTQLALRSNLKKNEINILHGIFESIINRY